MCIEQRIASEYASSLSGRSLRRCTSEIITGCAHGRSAGVVRGGQVSGTYRAHQLTKMLAEPIQCLRELQVEIDEP
jgi:hypothetical protein